MSLVDDRLAAARRRIEGLDVPAGETHVHERSLVTGASFDGRLEYAFDLRVLLPAGAERAKVVSVLRHAFDDLRLLLAAIDERDELLWIVSRDHDAYRAGQEAERKVWADRLAMKADAMEGKAGQGDRTPYVLRALVEQRLKEALALRPALPPDRVNARLNELHEGLAKVRLLVSRIEEFVELYSVDPLLWAGDRSLQTVVAELAGVVAGLTAVDT